jgi:hypothetical protein
MLHLLKIWLLLVTAAMYSLVATCRTAVMLKLLPWMLVASSCTSSRVACLMPILQVAELVQMRLTVPAGQLQPQTLTLALLLRPVVMLLVAQAATLLSKVAVVPLCLAPLRQPKLLPAQNVQMMQWTLAAVLLLWVPVATL